MKTNLVLSVLIAVSAMTAVGSSVGAVDVTTDGSRTAFWLRTQGVVEWGGNFIRIEAVEPSGRTTVIETGFLWPTNAAGKLLPWSDYGQVLSEDAEFLHVVERTWPSGTRFIFTLVDRDGATLGQMSVVSTHAALSGD